MKQSKKIALWILVYVLTIVIVAGVFIFCYTSFPFFKTLFTGEASISLPTAATATDSQTIIETAKKIENINESASLLSAFIFVMIIILQIFAFLTASIVFTSLKHSAESTKVILSKVENADIFLDLPLYFGLLGTVSSFIVMSFNPNISRLIAYSSTLVGIIFSVILRLVLHYPLKQRLICALTMEQEMKEKKQ